jgi:hypothetical protein
MSYKNYQSKYWTEKAGDQKVIILPFSERQFFGFAEKL